MARLRQFKENPLDCYSTVQMLLYSWDIIFNETRSYSKAMSLDLIADKLDESVQTVSNVIYQRRRCLRAEKKLAELFHKYTANMDKNIYNNKMRFSVSRSKKQRLHRRKLQLWINHGRSTKRFRLKKRFVSRRKGWVQE